MELDERLRAYARSRADAIVPSDADLLASRSLAGRRGRSAWPGHGFKAASAIGLALIVLVGGAVLGIELRSLRIATAKPTPGPLPSVPNEIVALDSDGQDPSLVTPFRLRDQKLLPPEARLVAAPGTGLMIASNSTCDSTTIRVVDLVSPDRDQRPPVELPGCYQSPTIVPNSTTVLLDQLAGVTGHLNEAGVVAYDWSAGRVIKSYPNARAGFEGALVSADGARFYTIASGDQGNTLDIFDLTTDTLLAQADVQVFGFNGGGIAISPDGNTLYLNEGIWLRTFDARTGKAGRVLQFKDPNRSPVAMLPAWLSSWLPAPIDVEAKEGFEIGHGLAVDPQGRWVAALGVDDNAEWQGIWVFDTASGRLLHHVGRSSSSSHFRGLARSLDGSALYALEAGSRQVAIDVVDPLSGRVRTIASAHLAGMGGINSVEAPR